MARAFIFGILLTVAVAAGVAYGAVLGGLVPANADARPSKIEAWAARTSLHATIAREAPKEANPVALTDENLVAGVKLYAQDCAVCHGDKSAKSTDIAHGLYQKPPQLAKDGVEDDPEGVTFWKVKHGIRLTGMPAYAADLSDTQIWQLALFLKHMDKLPPKADKEWKNVHVKGKERAGDRK
jgi:mono/diheme cytochrome c family protein